MARSATLLPAPDSPTVQSTSPASSVKSAPLIARTVPSPGDCYCNGHVWMSPRGALALYPDGHVLTAETTLVVQFTSLLDRSSGLVLSSAMSFGTSQL